MSCKLTEINFEILVIVQSSKNCINMTFSDVLIELDHESVELIKINKAKVTEVYMWETGNCIKISLALPLFFLFFNFNMIVQLLFNQSG